MQQLTADKARREYAIFIFLLYFFILKDWLEQNISFIGYGDELIALFAVPLYVFNLRKNQFKVRCSQCRFYKYIVLFLVAGLLASAINMYQDFLTIALADAFLCIKFWLALYVGTQLFEKLDLKRFGKKIYGHVKFITAVYCILVVLDQILQIFPATIRYGMRSTQLMYSHSVVFEACCTYLVAILLTVRDYAQGYKKWLLILLLLMCTTLRSKAFGTVFVIALICYFVFYRKKTFRLRTLIIFAPLIVFIGWGQIEYYFWGSSQSESARYQLLITSIEIMKDYFPLGTGFGTFASYYSGINYSPIYSIYGLSNIYGLEQGSASFISDSFWPMILGQTGIIGTIAYGIALFILFKAIQKIRIVNASRYAAALCGISYLLILSTAGSAFVHPVAMPIAIMLGLLLKNES